MLSSGDLYATAGKIGPLKITDSKLLYTKINEYGKEEEVFSINPAETDVGAYNGISAIRAQSAKFDVQKFGLHLNSVSGEAY